ncbi:hypothetical protein ACFPIJ_51390 [Dactylosporangium cerinum]|uniref:Uncharacterized protein n=1 Tax=Dactylosporangium cerinum TaxID=1434730 RepID=A0ABV9WFE7_9ACTN
MTQASGPVPPGGRIPPAERAQRNVHALVAGFDKLVCSFEAAPGWPGPSLYFHDRAIQVRREHTSAMSLLRDDRFLEYVYAVLPAWGMHRMGDQAAKVCDFEPFSTAVRNCSSALEELWDLRITALTSEQDAEVASKLWDIIARLKVSRSETQIVAGSKALHHVLPDLLPPIDRQYTFRFFTGQKQVAGDRRAFLDWYPHLAEIGRRARDSIMTTLERGGFMATGEAKVIDNAIIAFMRRGAVLPDKLIDGN